MGASYQSLQEKYDLCNHTIIYQWKCKFGTAFAHFDYRPMKGKSSSISKQTNQLEKRLEQAEEALRQAKLKVVALETLIDVAETELGIPIRKKPGAEQSVS